MKIALTQLFPSIKQGRLKGYALVGSGVSLIRGLIREITDQYSSETLTEEAFVAQAETLFMPSLFSEAPKIVVVQQATSTKLAWYGSVMKTVPEGHGVIIVANASHPSLLQSTHIGVVTCYESTFEESKLLFQRHAAREPLRLTTEALAFCSELTRQGNWAEVCQLLTFCSANPITEEVVESLFELPHQESASFLLERFSMKATMPGCTRDPTLLDPRSIKEPIQTVRSWQRIILQLWQLKWLLERYPSDQAIKQVTPSIFFKQVPLMMKALSCWSLGQLSAAMETLLTAEVTIKQHPHQAIMVLFRFLRGVAS